MSGEPLLGKNASIPGMDYKEMTWERFLILRAWAQVVADKENATVCMVGSALVKTNPRDIDIAVVLPLARFVERFGEIPLPGTPEMRDWLRGTVHMARTEHYLSAMEAIGCVTRVDIKFCPDTWWTDKDRLVLATPKAG